MASTVHCVTVDAADPYALASWWAAVLGGRLADDDEPGDPAASVVGASVPLLFLRVDDPRVVKNRIHLDLQPEGCTREAEVERVVGLGATVDDDLRRPDGGGWVVLHDPEGNELCILRSAAQRAAMGERPATSAREQLRKVDP